jgi:hypothetical protein
MKSKNTFTALLFLIMMSGNMVTAQVKSEYDKTVDFTKFKTFTFKGWQKDSDKQIDDIDKKRVEDAFKAELSSRGLTSDDDNPDLSITLYIVIEEKTSISSYDQYHGGLGYDGGRGWGLGYKGMGTGSANTTFEEEDYKEGTLVIDFYDEQSKKLIFQGTFNSIINENSEKRDKTIPKNIGKLMKKYPVKAKK